VHGLDTERPGAEAHEAVLVQTSALRLCAEALAADPCDGHSLADIVRAGRALNGALRQPGLEVLLDGGDVLEKMALLGRTLSNDDATAATDVFRSLTSAVGILEQSLDAVVFGTTAEDLEAYGDAMLDAFPARWRPYIEPEEDDEPRDELRAESSSIDDAAEAEEMSLETTFVVEVLDRLAACEEAALDWKDCAGARSRLEAIVEHFATIEEAFAALGADARTLADARRLLSSAHDGGEPFDPDALAQTLLEVVDWARARAARACDLNAFATDLTPELSVERLRSGPQRGRGDDPAVDVERVLRGLRQPLRDAAAAAACAADLDTSSPALRMDAKVADRIARALAVLLRSAFDARSAETSRPAVLRVLRLRVESWQPTEIVVVVDEERRPSDDGEDDGEEQSAPEALHGIDLRRDPTPADWEHLTYRTGFANVVVMVVPDGCLRAAEAAS
jgi:hypothetical protein